MTITYAVMNDDIPDDGYLEAYMGAVEAALRAAFPGAAINIQHSRSRGYRSPSLLQVVGTTCREEYSRLRDLAEEAIATIPDEEWLLAGETS